MASKTDKAYCVICDKERVAYKCEGCSQSFCVNHLTEHHQTLGKQLEIVEDKRNIFVQTLTQQKIDPEKYPLIQEINQWEVESIKKIQKTAEEARQLMFQHYTRHIDEIETKLTKLTEELKQTREENDFNEIHLNQLQERLAELQEELAKPHIAVQKDSSSFISKISVVISSSKCIDNIKIRHLCIPNINVKAKWIQNGTTVAGGNGNGNASNQLSCPWAIDIDDDQALYIVDYYNRHVVEWKKGATSGRVVAGGKGPSDTKNALRGPSSVMLDKNKDCLIICEQSSRRVMQWPLRNSISGETIISGVNCWDVFMDSDGYLYVSDFKEHEVRRWKIGDSNGVIVAGGNGQGNHLNQLSAPRHIFVDQDYSVYVSDYGNHRVMKWMKGAKEGIVVAGGYGEGSGLSQFSGPSGISVDQLGTIYVADHGNERVMRWLKGAKQGSVVVGGNGKGVQANQFDCPINLKFDRENNLYVIDYKNCRIQKFAIDYKSMK